MSPAALKNMEENKTTVMTTSPSSNDGGETVKGYSDAVEVRFSDFCKV
jgi:retinoblastoma-like protein 1